MSIKWQRQLWASFEMRLETLPLRHKSFWCGCVISSPTCKHPSTSHEIDCIAWQLVTDFRPFQYINFRSWEVKIWSYEPQKTFLMAQLASSPSFNKLQSQIFNPFWPRSAPFAALAKGKSLSHFMSWMGIVRCRGLQKQLRLTGWVKLKQQSSIRNKFGTQLISSSHPKQPQKEALDVFLIS